MAVGSQFAQYINPLLRALKDLGGSARAAEGKAAVAEVMKLGNDVLEETPRVGSRASTTRSVGHASTWLGDAISTHRGEASGR